MHPSKLAMRLAASLLMTVGAMAQMPLPSFSGSFFASGTRGFYFQAPINCVVTGLRVPDVTHPYQVVEFIDFGLAAPLTYPASGVGNQLFYDNSTVSQSVITTAIPLVQGNWYGVLGAGTATVGGAVSQNPIGSVQGSFSSSILTLPTSVGCLATAGGIGASGGNQPCYAKPLAAVSRVEVYVTGDVPGSAYAWGYNSHGQADVTPLPVAGLSYVEVSAGRWHSAARRNDGAVVAWGRNGDGQCNVPARPAGVTFVEVSAGGWHTLALRSDGVVSAWGRNTDGQCNVPGLPAGVTYVEVAAGSDHSVARRSDGEVVAWGQNYDGQCSVPSLPLGLVYDEIAAGMSHTLARRSDGQIKAWGANFAGQCNVPSAPTGLDNVEIAAGLFHSLARRSDGSVVAWGSNSDGQSNVPALPAGLTYRELAAGAAHTVALRSDGSLVAWGRNIEGQCSVPTGVIYVDVAAGGNHTMARGNPIMASVEAYGAGCPAGQRLTLSSSLPQLGTSWVLSASAIESSASLCVFWLGDQMISPGYNLVYIGAPGCFAYTNGNIYAFVEAASGGGSSHAIAVPNSPSLVGAYLTAQVSAPSSATLIGFSTSNGIVATLGR
jgi:hypothetical protein